MGFPPIAPDSRVAHSSIMKQTKRPSATFIALAIAAIIFPTSVAALPLIDQTDTARVTSRMFDPRENYGVNESENSSDIFDEGNAPEAVRRSGFGQRALNRVAHEIQKMQRRSADNPFSKYSRDLQKLQDHFDRAEASANSVGIDKSSFRQGVAVTTATAATAMGALYLINPAGMTGNLMSTRIRAGYDVSRIDNPKMFLSYDDRLTCGVNRNGLEGSFKDLSGRVYVAELDVFKMRGTVKLNF